MPPITPFPPPPPTSGFPLPTPQPPQRTPEPGMDQQTKNVILFGVIFSVLALGVGAYIFLKPLFVAKTATTTESAATPATTTTPLLPVATSTAAASTTAPSSAPPQQKSFLSSLLSLFSAPSASQPVAPLVPAQPKVDSFAGPGGSSGGSGSSGTSPSVTSMTPAPGSTLAGTSQLFVWNSVPGATNYALWIGTHSHWNDIARIESTNGSHSYTVTNLPDTSTPLYVTVWYLVNKQWLSQDITPVYTSAGPQSQGQQPPTPTDNSLLTVGIYGNTNITQQQLDLINNQTVSSPLRGEIWISSVRRSTDPDKEYVTLSTSKSFPSGTDITGMVLKSLASGQTVEIGQAVALPYANTINTSHDILLDPGDKAYIVTGHSPVGYSFHLNICTGYFEQFQSFTPSLPKNCPLLKDEPLPLAPNQLSDTCLNEINSWARCKTPTSYSNTGGNDQTYDCQMFFQNHTGYQNCVNLHQSDSDFYSPAVWQVYLSRSQSVWKSEREIIWLMDSHGRFISQYSY